MFLLLSLVLYLDNNYKFSVLLGAFDKVRHVLDELVFSQHLADNHLNQFDLFQQPF